MSKQPKSQSLQLLNKLYMMCGLLLLSLIMVVPGYAEVNPSNNSEEEKDQNSDGGEEECPEEGSDNDCVSFGFYFPILPLEDALGAQQFKLVQHDPAPTLFSPQALSYSSIVLTYVATITPQADLPAGIAHEFEITNQKNKAMKFHVPVGASTGCTVEDFSNLNYKIQLLDINKALTTASPEYYRLLRGDGSKVDYPASEGNVPQLVETPEGRTIDLIGLSSVDILLEDGSYRQLKSAAGLADIVIIDDLSYEIRFYTESNTGPKFAEFYQPIGAPYRTILIENPTGDPDIIDQIRITDSHGTYSSVSEWNYVPAAGDWAFTQGGGLLVEQLSEVEVTNPDLSIDRIIKTRELRDSNGDLVSKHQEISKDLGWRSAVVEKIEDPDGIALSTYYDYYTNEAEAGRYGKEKQVTYPNGSWIKYDYDAEGRKIQEITPWLDSPVTATASQAVEKAYSYTPVDAHDSSADFDDRPRTIITKELGIETRRTYNTYYTNASTGDFVHVEERATVQGAAYGASTNLRTIRTYHANSADAASAGRLKSLETPEGRYTLYTYSETSDRFIEQIDALVQPGTPVAYKSTRRVLEKDLCGNLLSEKLYVYDGSTWSLLTETTQTWSDELAGREFQLLERAKDGRILLEQTWSGPLVSTREDETGSSMSYFYDALGRVEMEVKAGVNGQPDIVTTFDRSLGAIDCGCDGERIVIRQAGSLSLTSMQKTDAVGRRSQVTDKNGYTTTFSYVDDELVTTQINPDGSTLITTKYLDGRTKSMTGTRVIAEYYDYSVNTDGSTVTRVSNASTFSPRYQETTYDVAWGRMIQSVRPSFTGGLFTQTMVYNTRGLLEKETATGMADTLFEYDGFGNLIRSALDVDQSGSILLVSTDRITDQDTFYQKDNLGDWFKVSIVKIYPEDGSSSSVIVSETKQRLSNFVLAGTNGDLASEIFAKDVYGNQTVSARYIDRAAKTVTELTDTPFSLIDAKRIFVNGLLVSENTSEFAAATTYTYDGLERLVSVKEPRHANGSQIDYYAGTSQIFTRTDAAGNTTAYTYYAQGEVGASQIASITDPLLQKAYYAYDLLGRQTYLWGQKNYPQAYGYNAYGELSMLTTYRDATDAFDFTTFIWPNPTGGDTTTWSYDAATGLLTRKQYADGNGTDYSYDSANRLATRTWARSGGLDTDYSYSLTTGELLSVDYEDPNTVDLVYTYDRLGRQSTVTDATGTRSFAYDSSTLQLTAETLDSAFYDSHELLRAYDTLGRSIGYILQDSAFSTLSAVNYSYDTASGRIFTVSDGSDTFIYGYEPSSNLLASIAAPHHDVVYSYETNRDLMTIIDNQASGASSSQYTYTHDGLGRRTNRAQSGSATNTTSTDVFGYNGYSEVISSSNSIETAAKWNPSYSYDKIGNRKTSTGIESVTYTANALNQYADIQVSSLSSQSFYDLDGNLTGDGGNWTYNWNNENRLASATDGSRTIHFTYDYQGRLVKKDDGRAIEVYVYDGWNRIATFDSQVSTLSLQVSYLWGLDLSGSLQGAGGVGWLLKEGSLYPTYDANGYIMQKLDGNGVTVMNVAYDPFGNIISGTLVGEYGFSTKPFVVGPDWYYYGFRYYDPVTGRWPNRDPIEERGGLNLYTMVGNDAVSQWDYLGLDKIKVPWLKIEYYRGGELVLGASFSFGQLPWIIDKALGRYGDYQTIVALGGTAQPPVQKYQYVPECYIIKDLKGITDAGFTSWDWHPGGSRKPRKPGEPVHAGVTIDFVTIIINYWRSIEWEWIPDPKDECCK